MTRRARWEARQATRTKQPSPDCRRSELTSRRRMSGTRLAEECITGASRHAVWAAMYGATVTVADPTPPTLSTPYGTLWAAGEAGGFHKGTETVSGLGR